MKTLLLISNSTMAGEAYLEWPREHIFNFLNENNVKKVVFAAGGKLVHVAPGFGAAVHDRVFHVEGRDGDREIVGVFDDGEGVS